MAQDNPIGLAELIAKVKQELLSPQADGQGVARLLSVDTVTLELNVTVEKKAEGGVHIHILTAGGSVGREDVQKVTVSLSPLVSKEERLRLFAENDPKGFQETRRASHTAFDKGGGSSRVG